jgi:hypothetical protein
MIPMQFLVNGFASAFAFGLVFAALATVEAATLMLWLAITAVLLVASLFLQVGHLLNGQYSHVAGQFSVRRLVSGDLQLIYLGGVVVAGLIVPLALVAYALSAGGGPNATLAGAVAGVLIVVGNWLSKHTVIRAGAYAPLM